jgi:hypothetical protein
MVQVIQRQEVKPIDFIVLVAIAEKTMKRLIGKILHCAEIGGIDTQSPIKTRWTARDAPVPMHKHSPSLLNSFGRGYSQQMHSYILFEFGFVTCDA